ncbi:class I SAM-dependent methyltransferase [Sulfurimonas sp. HSL-1656]|uniref:class I SAM-dependent methyltransferase n=1 Tax=Thiomicrolovo subterrani TaxID=3131934 RepID=UPI0031F72C5F
MIPFNHLGWAFSRFGAAVYPETAVAQLCICLHALPPDADILDLGAGTGTLANYALGCRNDLRPVAADPAEGMLRYVPETVGRVIARAEALPFDADRFDGILVGEALHHFTVPEEALDEIARVLRPGGLLFVYDFDPSTLLGNLLRRAEKLLGEPGHFYPPETLASLLRERGFSTTVNRYGWRYSLAALLEA